MWVYAGCIGVQFFGVWMNTMRVGTPRMHALNMAVHCRPDDIFWCTADIGWVTGEQLAATGLPGAGRAGRNAESWVQGGPGSGWWVGPHVHTYR